MLSMAAFMSQKIVGWLWESWRIAHDICLSEMLRLLCWWYFLGRTLNSKSQWEMWTGRLMQGGLRWHSGCGTVRKQARWGGDTGKGRPPIAKQWSETLHICSIGSLIGLKLRQLTGRIQFRDPAPLSVSMFLLLITQWNSCRVHIM